MKGNNMIDPFDAIPPPRRPGEPSLAEVIRGPEPASIADELDEAIRAAMPTRHTVLEAVEDWLFITGLVGLIALIVWCWL
jgi:hypothetical protein